jgi:diketogulonate reductase-like aldo/keto reductase
MRFKYLNRTKEKISAIGMGTWRMGSLDPDTRKAELETIRFGLEAGINLIDTAESYGSGESEKLVGEAVRGIRDSVFLATKVSPENLSYDNVIKSCYRSLERLGTSYIDLYQIHWPNPRIPIKQTMRAMEKLVNEGKIRYIGVSNFSLQQLKEAEEALSRAEVVSNQVEYSFAVRSIEKDMLPYAEKEKITVIAYSPLARGKIPTNLIPDNLLSKYNATPAQVILAWVGKSESVVPIPKSANPEHMRENAAASDIILDEPDYIRLSSLF